MADNHVSELKIELQRLYSDSSKHSTYQNIPDFVSAELGYTEALNENWRSDRPRFDYLARHRLPVAGETWLDFGANTGFFVLSLAYRFPQTSFIAVEANPNHADFIRRISGYFDLRNIEVIQRAIGLRELQALPRSDFMLHLNVLHHAGHDFDSDIVPTRLEFSDYAGRYLSALRTTTGAMLFQMGSNWGGDKSEPLVGVREDVEKLRMFALLLTHAGWCLERTSYPHRGEDGRILYADMARESSSASGTLAFLDDFPGEFHRRPLFICSSRPI